MKTIINISLSLCVSLLSFSYNSKVKKILHISDIHYDTSYKVGAPSNCWINNTSLANGIGCCRTEDYINPQSPYHASRKFGEVNCDAPRDLVEGTFQWIQENIMSKDEIAFVLYTGDSVNHNDPLQTISGNVTMINEIQSLFDQYMPNTPVYNSVGNHDTWPIDNFSPTWFLDLATKKFFSNNWNNWKKWLSTETDETEKSSSQETNVKTGSYFNVPILDNKVMLVSYNSSIYDSLNKILGSSSDPFGQFNWLKNTLEEAKVNKQRVWIIEHEAACSGKDFARQTFMDLLKEYSDIIDYILGGHTHTNEILHLTDTDGNYLNSTLLVASITQIAHQAAFRVYDLDEANLRLQDSTNYTLDLEGSYTNDKVTYHEAYKFSSSYGLEYITKETLKDLYNRFQTDDALVTEYWANYQVDTNGDKCDANCIAQMRSGMLCNQNETETEYEDSRYKD